MAPTKDPFAGSREEKQPPPVDTLDDQALDELEVEILNKYKMEFRLEALGTSRIIPAHAKGDLIQHLEAALATSPDFQKAVLDEYVTPYIYNFGDLRINERWALGIFLPGLYSYFDTFEAGFTFMEKILPDAATRARKTIESLILKHVSSKMDRLK